MDIYAIGDSRTVATVQDLGCFAKFYLQRPNSFTCNNFLALCSDSLTETSELLQITAAFLPAYASAPPVVKSNYKTTTRTILWRKRRIRRRTISSDDSDENEDYGFFGGDGYGTFGGGSGGGGGGNGKGWNFNGFGGHDWDDSSSPPPWSAPALSFIYEVICWIALSNCVHFAFKKLARTVPAGIEDADREKVPIRLASIC
ncbi:hypothetical protein SLA2020_072320 [Shorea laevis]